MKQFKSQKLRDSARGQDCTVNIRGVCNHRSDTVILAHSPFDKTGIGTKPHDFLACFACSACHDALHGNVKPDIPRDELYEYFHEAMKLTWEYWIEAGLLK